MNQEKSNPIRLWVTIAIVVVVVTSILYGVLRYEDLRLKDELTGRQKILENKLNALNDYVGLVRVQTVYSDQSLGRAINTNRTLYQAVERCTNLQGEPLIDLGDMKFCNILFGNDAILYTFSVFPTKNTVQCYYNLLEQDVKTKCTLDFQEVDCGEVKNYLINATQSGVDYCVEG